MKKLIISIVKTILVYIIYMIMISVLSTLIIKQFYNNSYFEIVILLLCNQLDVQHQVLPGIIVVLKKLIEGISLAVLASLIFSYIINREAKIIFPEKLVLRRRTSEGNVIVQSSLSTKGQNLISISDLVEAILQGLFLRAKHRKGLVNTAFLSIKL